LSLLHLSADTPVVLLGCFFIRRLVHNVLEPAAESASGLLLFRVVQSPQLSLFDQVLEQEGLLESGGQLGGRAARHKVQPAHQVTLMVGRFLRGDNEVRRIRLR
jgi:hypothetical protein